MNGHNFIAFFAAIGESVIPAEGGYDYRTWFKNCRLPYGYVFSIDSLFKENLIANNRNTYAKRQREHEKRQRAEDKRRKRENKINNPVAIDPVVDVGADPDSQLISPNSVGSSKIGLSE